MISAPTAQKNRARRRKERCEAARLTTQAHMTLHGWLPMKGSPELARPEVAIWNPESGCAVTWFAAGGYGTIQNATREGMAAKGLRECEWVDITQGRFFAMRDLVTRRGWL